MRYFNTLYLSFPLQGSLPTHTFLLQVRASLFYFDLFTIRLITTIVQKFQSPRKAPLSSLNINQSLPTVRKKVGMFFPFPKITDVHLTGAEEFLILVKARIFGIGGMYARSHCGFLESKDTFGLFMTQLKHRGKLIKLVVEQITDEQHKYADITKSFVPKQYQMDLAIPRCSKQFIGAINALVAGLILGDPLKEAACTAVSIFAFGNDVSRLPNGVEDIRQTEKETKKL